MENLKMTITGKMYLKAATISAKKDGLKIGNQSRIIAKYIDSNFHEGATIKEILNSIETNITIGFDNGENIDKFGLAADIMDTYELSGTVNEYRHDKTLYCSSNYEQGKRISLQYR